MPNSLPVPASELTGLCCGSLWRWDAWCYVRDDLDQVCGPLEIGCRLHRVDEDSLIRTQIALFRADT